LTKRSWIILAFVILHYGITLWVISLAAAWPYTQPANGQVMGSPMLQNLFVIFSLPFALPIGALIGTYSIQFREPYWLWFLSLANSASVGALVYFFLKFVGSKRHSD
jgi:hypothetical protein